MSDAFDLPNASNALRELTLLREIQRAASALDIFEGFGIARDGLAPNHNGARAALDQRLRAYETRGDAAEPDQLAVWTGRAQLAEAEASRLRALIDTPHTSDFLEAVKLEAAHQRSRWGEDDASKVDSDWLAIVVHLASKAHFNWMPLDAQGEIEKKLHRVISVGAAAMNWFESVKARGAL